jgi:uncharacterized protein (TIGR00251 family)
METWIRTHQKGTLLLLHIQPGAARNQLSGIHGERLKVKIKAAPKDGEANEGLIDYFSEILNISKSKIFLIRGESSRQKDLLVELPHETLLILLRELL